MQVRRVCESMQGRSDASDEVVEMSRAVDRWVEVARRAFASFDWLESVLAPHKLWPSP